MNTLPSPRPAAVPRVLVVEVDPAVRGVLGEGLGEAGYRVLSADHALDPVDVAPLRPDLVVLDLRLDGADRGWQLLLAMRAMSGTAGLPIVVSTAEREADRLRALGARLVLKPFDLDELLRSVSLCRTGSESGGDGTSPMDGDAGNDSATEHRHRNLVRRRSESEANAMRYGVTYLLAGGECPDQVETRDAARSVTAVEPARRRAPARFELLAVTPLDTPTTGRGDTIRRGSSGTHGTGEVCAG